MVELLKQGNYDVTHFQPFMEYIKSLEQIGYKLLSVEEGHEFIDEKYEGENHTLEILTMKNKNEEWVSIYKYKNQHERFEQIEFMTFSDEYFAFYGPKNYNQIINYSAHFEDEQFASIVCSCYSYKDNQLIDGWRKLRKFDVRELEKVMYSKSMNLKELTMMADEKISEFKESISLKGDKVKELKLGY